MCELCASVGGGLAGPVPIGRPDLDQSTDQTNVAGIADSTGLGDSAATDPDENSGGFRGSPFTIAQVENDEMRAWAASPYNHHNSVKTISSFETSFKGAHETNMRALIYGRAWGSKELTYSFTDSTADYTSGAYANRTELENGFKPFNAAQKAAAVRAFSLIESYTNLKFTEVTDAQGQGEADIRMAGSGAPSTAWAYYPSKSPVGGDVWINSASAHYSNPRVGTYGNHTFQHEIGHALGLKHGHDSSGYGALDAAHDHMAYSVMTYKSYQGHTTGGYTNEYYGYTQTYMAYDIAALQAIYGINWETNNTDSTYTFSRTTGETFINGVSVNAPASPRIFSTIWDGGGVDTIDLSNYDENVTADMRSGGAIHFSQIQTAQLTAGKYADGNIFMAIAPEESKRAMIENLTTSSGNDKIKANRADNRIEAGSGNDDVITFGGDDFLFGGDGNDRLSAGAGKDRLDGGLGRDTLKGGGGREQDVFVLDEHYGRDVAVKFDLGIDKVDVPNVADATLLTSNTGWLTVEYHGAWMILRGHKMGDAALEDLVI